MPTEITMPRQSDTMTEGTVVKWLKKEGDQVKAGEMIAEIETDKAVMEMESFEAGTLAVVVAREGQKVAVGAPIAVLAKKGEDSAEIKKKYAGGAKASSAPAPAKQQQQPVAAAAGAGSQQISGRPSSQPAPATQVGAMDAMNTAELKEPDEVQGHGATREKAHPVPALPTGGNGHGERTKVSPVAKRIAQDKG